MKRIGFLTFGHYQPGRGSVVPTAHDAILQTIELAVAAEEIGLDGAYLRVHHFARQQSSPFPVLAAIAARTQRIEMGTAVIDMRYENPLYMAEEAAQTDLIAGGRLKSASVVAHPSTLSTGLSCSAISLAPTRRRPIWPAITQSAFAKPLPASASLDRIHE